LKLASLSGLWLVYQLSALDPGKQGLKQAKVKPGTIKERFQRLIQENKD